MGFDWAALGGAALSLGGAVYGARQAGKAADAQADAARQAQYYSEKQAAQAREDTAPWRAVGEDALYKYGSMLGIIPTDPGVDQYAGFRDSPGYQYQLEEGVGALEKSQAAKGLLHSGQTLKGVLSYGQNLASQNYGDYANRLASVSGLGQTAAAQGAALGQAYSTNTGAAMQNAGAARASGYMGQAAAAQGGLQGISSYLGYL